MELNKFTGGLFLSYGRHIEIMVATITAMGLEPRRGSVGINHWLYSEACYYRHSAFLQEQKGLLAF